MKSSHAHHSPHHIFFIIIGVVFFLNIIVLDYFLLRFLTQQPSVLGVTTATDSCPRSCISQFSQYVGNSSAAAKEYFVPLGTGTGATDDWTDVVGAQAAVDTKQYRTIKTVHFEVTVQVPTGNQTVWVRLYNATDKHPVWYSEVSMNGTGPTALISQPISLDSGNKLYQVQMKTQLKYPATILQGRLRMQTN